ncbi:MAG: hypothetical protein DMG04_22715 [Acidobacteria bacterium]|nr:MAG: hypothetical protein DMG04_22715 [Acidobacteriota bacterium]PYQ85130.1 MAG: hypothetical protein DMG03_09290 [Acidobacteriota bacterium]PYQ91940.1 MAG: hypothetical protein DMG02_04560 [Acidobacteriota bacterium]PYR08177.1 MAG: hypothetical protein DMF99_20070 [Acidobacteriota bacterium]
MSELHLPHGAHAESPRVDSPDVRHEESDVNIRAIFGFGIGLAVAGIVISFVVWLLFQYFEARESRKVTPEFPLAAQQENRLPPEPRLQTNPRADLADLRAQEENVLKTYGWIDKKASVVRIPIEEAMKLTVQRGLPARQERR